MAKTWKTAVFAGLLAVALLLLGKSVSDGGGDEAFARSPSSSADPDASMAEMMMALPEVPKEMQDPLLDPMMLSQMHTHDGVQQESDAERQVRIEWEWDGVPEAGVQARLTLTITGGDGLPVADYEINHEKKLHLIAISRDLSQFVHVHPDYEGQGRFRIGMTFPTGGEYRLFADFMPIGMIQLTRAERIFVQGAEPEGEAAVQASKRLKTVVRGMEVELHLGHLMAGMPSTIAFTFRDRKTGKPVRDLEPYLGAVGHVVATDPLVERYIHVHPVNALSSGPQALFSIDFPESGTYKLWGQFKRGGEVFVVPFVLEVP
ncbi:hypothetical protein B1A99_29385 [Cohnella sp. CIP 111063]|uniref:hypothetical protein n=1 Tax=unclassified Cohnella TaxID=2636738 RepID=UPI000B8C3B10|nr:MULTISPECIES: hypothetical protein [unclassified Cohnella]OXS53489.1 hypothetical protein B1A99_29385 [Cohnella sp. CIP 111063]PRX61507.1 hypothetical protein B0G52_12526 [Cohnella sp. SGD-V74]